MKKEQPEEAAQAARERLGGLAVQSVHLTGLMQAVRALIETHPEPESLRNAYDRYVGQMLAHPGFLTDTDRGTVLRELTANLFQAPVEP